MDFPFYEQSSEHGILQQRISNFMSSVPSTQFCSSGFPISCRIYYGIEIFHWYFSMRLGESISSRRMQRLPRMQRLGSAISGVLVGASWMFILPCPGCLFLVDLAGPPKDLVKSHFVKRFGLKKVIQLFLSDFGDLSFVSFSGPWSRIYDGFVMNPFWDLWFIWRVLFQWNL